MKINLAILDRDELYMNRISLALSNRFQGEIELYTFTNQQIAMNSISEGRIDVFLASTEFETNTKMLPPRCAFAYITENSGIQTFMDEKCICKFQKVELIYREIVGLYAEVSSNITEKVQGGADSKILLFSSPSGGTGNSAVAVACAVYLAKEKKNVLYINMEKLGSTKHYFQEDGKGDFSDVIYALKSRKSNIAMKIRSVIRTTKDGVKYIESCSHAMDRYELNAEDVKLLMEELRKLQEIECIVIDSDFSFEQVEWEVQNQADHIIMISDGSDEANGKIKNALTCLEILDQQRQTKIMEKIRFCYNRFSNKSGSLIGREDIEAIGGIPKYKNATTWQIIQEISTKQLFDCFVKGIGG